MQEYAPESSKDEVYNTSPLIYTNQFHSKGRMIFKYEAPNAYLYEFHGTGTTSDGDTFPIDSINFVLRGCSLRNTDWCYGCVAYTGYYQIF
jgi:hypothetical protein